MPRTRPLVWIVLLAVLLSAPASRAEETARQILDRAKQLDDTTRKWSDRSQTLTLTIHGKSGAPRERSLKIFDKRGSGGEDKTVTFFLAPAEVKGTAFLQWSHPGKDNEQWLYLPELNRTRRITSQLRDQSFMGTDFSYRDLEILAEIRGWTEAQAASSLTGSEDVDGHACWVIALTPTDGGYGKIVLSLDKELLVPRKLVFHDAGGTVVKTLVQSDVKNVGAIPTPYRMEMQTPAKESRTEVVLSDVKYDTGLADDFFTERQLQRGPR